MARKTQKDKTVTKTLRKGEYLVLVTYDPLPSLSRLRKEFGKEHVSKLFDGRYWYPYASQRMAQTPGEKVFLVKHFGRETESEANIAEMDSLGYRPATHLEAYSFQRAHPELQRRFWIAALGSHVFLYDVTDEDGDNRYVAVLGGDADRRVLGDGWFGNRWRAVGRFLFVRKEHEEKIAETDEGNLALRVKEELQRPEVKEALEHLAEKIRSSQRRADVENDFFERRLLARRNDY